jgi:hypothetical protein
MQTASRRRRRTIIATAVSAVVHVAVLTVVAIQAPTLPLPPQEHGPPEAIIPILIMPRTPPPPAGSNTKPAPIRLHRRPQRNLPAELPVTPLPVPAPAPSAPAAPSRPLAPIHPAPQPEGPKGDVKAALRHSPVGCGNTLAVGLSRAERELCDESLGKGAKDAEFIPPGMGMTPAKRALLDQAAAAKDAAVRRKEAPLTTSLSKPFVEPSDYEGEPHITGAGASAIGQVTYPPDKRAAKKLKRLPP